MTQETLMLAQLFSIVLAACGTPGLTFWVMKKMSREALSHIKENCKNCRSHLDEKIDGLENIYSRGGAETTRPQRKTTRRLRPAG